MDEFRRQAKLDQLLERLRVAFLQGAEAESRRALGRGLTKQEFERVLERYTGRLAVDEWLRRASHE